MPPPLPEAALFLLEVMNFAEIRFWQFLLAGLSIIGLFRFLFIRIRPKLVGTFDKVALLGLGLFLLLCVSWTTCIIFLVVAVTTYGGLALILKYRATCSLRFLLILIPLQLLPLLYYKYADFVVNQVLGLNLSWLHGLLIPVGISFYSFQKVAFAIDTLVSKQPLPAFLDFMNFASFFPQIVAGPIERRGDLLWIVVGLFFKCCLADNLTQYINVTPSQNAYLIWLANLLFGLRIYYDFAGYSLVAVGLARCLGVRLTLNFTSPYCATSITEFWRRWHITLSRWFRDYLYIPLGGGRTRWWAGAVVLVFVASGIWHGAGWNFVFWGALHAAFLILNRSAAKLPVPGPLGWGLTMLATFFAWLCFYEHRPDVLFRKIAVLLSPVSYNQEELRATITQLANPHGFVLTGFLVMMSLVTGMEWLSIRRKNEPYYYLRQNSVGTALVILTVLLAPGKNNAFIYFAF